MLSAPVCNPASSTNNPVIMVVDDDFAARLQMSFSLGNDSFTVVEAESGLEEPLFMEGQRIILTASLGISVYPDDGEDIDTLLKNADTAMYEAKERGRNSYQFFQSAMNDAAMARFHMSNNLRRALDNGEFVLYYQPQYTNKNGGRLTGVEALIRWIDPDRGVMLPDTFLPFAEESGFIHSINDWVIREACTQAQKWVMAGLFTHCRMGINISGKNIKFQQLGAKIIAIDDFGTGYSALSHLQLFPLSTLKIEKSFVHNLDRTANGLSLLHSIVDMAKSFNLKVVAEGVETEDQKNALQQMNCDDLQGYLLGRPIPRQKLEELLLLGVGA